MSIFGRMNFKGIFIPKSQVEFQARLKELSLAITELGNTNNKEMKTPLERIKLAEKELKAAKEALQPKPDYIITTETGGNDTDSRHCDKTYQNKHEVFKVIKVISDTLKHLTFCYLCEGGYVIRHDFCKPSTKEAFDAQNEIILVPDCIKFENIYKGLGIVFNDNKQTLWLQSDFYSVARSHKIHIKDGSNFKLTKCERSDLKASDVAFIGIMDYIKDLDCYVIILDNKRSVHVSDNEDCIINTNDSQDKTWYKVEKI